MENEHFWFYRYITPTFYAKYPKFLSNYILINRFLTLLLILCTAEEYNAYPWSNQTYFFIISKETLNYLLLTP